MPGNMAGKSPDHRVTLAPVNVTQRPRPGHSNSRIPGKTPHYPGLSVHNYTILLPFYLLVADSPPHPR